jgi:hypothetical protein
MRFHRAFFGNQHEIWLKQHNGKVREKSMLSYEAFLEKVRELSEAGFSLSIDKYDRIRFFSPSGDEHCPITAVWAMETGKTCVPRQAANIGRKLGMGRQTILTVVKSADMTTNSKYWSGSLHCELLAAFSSQPQEEQTPFVQV